MARFELKLPKMGESVAEATITNWLKEVGDKIEADEAVLEIATDKVDSEVPSEVSGILVEQLFGKDDLVQVGQTIAIIDSVVFPTTWGCFFDFVTFWDHGVVFPTTWGCFFYC